MSVKNATQQYSLPWLFGQGTRNVISGVAFVTTHGAHIMPPAIALWHQKLGIGYSGWVQTLNLTICFREWPQSILKTGQCIAFTLAKLNITSEISFLQTGKLKCYAVKQECYARNSVSYKRHEFQNEIVYNIVHFKHKCKWICFFFTLNQNASVIIYHTMNTHCKHIRRWAIWH